MGLRWRIRAIEAGDEDTVKSFAFSPNYLRTKVSETSFLGNDELKDSHCGVNESKQVFAF